MSDLYYHILGLQPGATAAEIKQAYRTLAKQWHPDRFLDQPEQQKRAAARFQEIHTAYEFLKDATPDPAATDSPRPQSPHVEVKPANASFYYQLALTAIHQGSDRDAVEHLTHAIHLDPHYQAAYQCRAFLHEKLGFTRRAEADFRKAAELKVAAAYAQSEPIPAPDPSPPTPDHPPPLIQSPHPITALALDPTGQRLLLAQGPGEVSLWDGATGALGDRFTPESRPVQQVLWHPHAEQWVTVSQEQGAKLWGRSADAGPPVLRWHQDGVLSAAFSLDGQSLIVGRTDRTVQLWQLSPRRCRTISGYRAAVAAIAMSPTAPLFATGGLEPQIRIRDYHTGKLRRSLRSNGGVLCLVYSPTGQYLAAGGYNAIAQLWNLAESAQPRQLIAHQSRITAIAFSPDHLHIATGGWDRTIYLWTLTTGDAIATFTGHSDVISGLAFHPNGSTLYSSSWDGTVRTWSL
ncbi:DnaJ domain-containing protein [Spirulina major CS-329]|uniref:DnaJ domain-containing protein n=1 Tax=Spirulina TaxID=1154 RepID=UPI00232E1FA1|nr:MULTISPECIES: DnaJ domain-containing protein [Spirulina]MDB9494129.1 DnaJ domain-containing protein [Spirulina subsalsa CS-330]MDB9502197.1 DnaJ domain-containing protein [Spirulina major CS-329]